MTPELVSFGCYGTLVDWRSGVIRACRVQLPGSAEVNDDGLFRAFVRAWRRAAGGRCRPYREVLEVVELRLAEELGLDLPAKCAGFLADSLPSWRPLLDTKPALRALARSGHRLAVLTNADAELLAESLEHFRVEFEVQITPQNAGACKPDPAHFRRALEAVGGDPSRLVHVGWDRRTDVEPARALGIPAVWVDRRRSTAEPHPRHGAAGRGGRTGDGSPQTGDGPPTLRAGDLREAAEWIIAGGDGAGGRPGEGRSADGAERGPPGGGGSGGSGPVGGTLDWRR